MNTIERYVQAKDSLESLTGSWVRSKIVLSLQAGPKRIKELAEAVGAGEKTTHHALQTMINLKSVERRHDGYTLTNVGRIQATLLTEMVNGLVALGESIDFWQNHNLNGIPPNLQARIGDLVGSKFLQAAPDSPLEVQRVFIEKMSNSKEISGVSPYIAPGYTEMVTGLLNGGAKVSLILTQGVIDKIDPGVLRSWLGNEKFSLCAISEPVTVAFCVADEILSLGLCNSDGSYDPLGDLMVPGPGAIAWGKELYEFYRNKSHKFEKNK